MEKLNSIINQFGGETDIAILCLLAFLFFIINSMITGEIFRFIFSLITGLFVLFQLVSLFFTQSFIGYQFFIHFNLRGIEGIAGLYIPQMILSFLLFVIIVFLFYSSRVLVYKKFASFLKVRDEHKPNITKISIILILIILATISFKGSFLSDSKSLFSILNSNTEEFETALNKIGLTNYIMPEDIKCEKGRNVIVLSLESFEKGFLNDKFLHLTPNLRSLKKDWNYYEIEQNFGSGWTSGSLYTCLTGFPAFFGVHANSIFQTAYHSQISSISHVLEKADYDIVYMNGNTDYSGIKEMLYSFHFTKVIDKENTNLTSSESTFGLRDKDLFELAKKEIKSNLQNGQAFSLFISTTDTHFPDGIYDNRMEAFVPPAKSNFEFMLSAVDYMVGEFIDFLKTEDLFLNTAVFIFPDHQKMGDPSILNGTGDRGLYLITNVEKEKIKIDTTRALYQIDLPKMILEGAEIKHNLKFLTDYILGNKNEYLKNNINQITEINTSGLLRIGSKPLVAPSAITTHYEEYKSDTMRFIAHAGGKIDKHTYTNSLEALELSYKKGFRLFELDIIKTKDGKYVAAHDWKHWKKITKYKDSVPVRKDEFLKHKIYEKYTPLDMERINEWFINHPDAILVTDKINEPELFSKVFADPERLMMELFDIDAVKRGIELGLKSSMPSQCIIENMTKSDIVDLKKIGIKNVAISRKFITDNVDFLNELINNNINPYAFHINLDYGIDEQYVVKYEMDNIYGIYADKWEFE